MTLSRFLVLAASALTVSSCKPLRESSALREDFSPLNDPAEFGIKAVKWNAVRPSVRHERWGWSGYYWAYSIGGINYRWQAPNDVFNAAAARAMAVAKDDVKARHAANVALIAANYANAGGRNLPSYKAQVDALLPMAAAANSQQTLQDAINRIDAWILAANNDIAAVKREGPFLARPRWILDQNGRTLVYAQDYIFEPKPAATVLQSQDPQLATLSPAEKYDLVMGSDFALTKAENERIRSLLRANGGIAPWEGICNGWSMAAVMIPEPGDKLRVKDATGKRCIPFRKADLKALASAAMAQARARTLNLGERCYRVGPQELAALARNRDNEINKYRDDQLRKCLDANPGAVFAVLTQRLAAGKPVIAEVGLDHQVWNHPVVGYTIRYFDPEKPQNGLLRAPVIKPNDGKPFRAKNTAKIIPVAMDIEYLIEGQPHEDDRKLTTRTLMFELETAADDTILGGTWYYNPNDLNALSSIDYLWTVEDDIDGVKSMQPESLELFYARKLVDMSREANPDHCGANEPPFKASLTSGIAEARAALLARDREYRDQLTADAAATPPPSEGGINNVDDFLNALRPRETPQPSTTPPEPVPAETVATHAAVTAAEVAPDDRRAHCLAITDGAACRKVEWCAYAGGKCFSIESTTCTDFPAKRYCAEYLGCEWKAEKCSTK